MKRLQLDNEQHLWLMKNGINKQRSMHEMFFILNNQLIFLNFMPNNRRKVRQSLVLIDIWWNWILVQKQQSYPAHILHPEEIPSLNAVPDQLEKRRCGRLQHQLSLETDEPDIPMVVAEALQDELQRAVQNRLEIHYFTFSNRFLWFSAAQDRNTEIELPDNFEHVFQPADSARQSRESHGFDQQKSVLSHGLSHDRTCLNESFQRIKIAGDFRDLSHIEDLEESVGPLLLALSLREKYSHSNLPSIRLSLPV